MKPNDKNWMLMRMIIGLAVGTVIAAAIWGITFQLTNEGSIRTSVLNLTGFIAIVLAYVTLWCVSLYRLIEYNGNHKSSRY